MFKTNFDNYTVVGDFISCELPDGFAAHAVVHHDADTQLPDGVPQEVMSSWANDEWCYVGISVIIWKCGVKLTNDFDHALWGIDCNYPDKDKNSNWYLRDVANDLLDDALEAAKKKIQELCK